MQDSPSPEQPQAIKFNNSFTPDIDIYIQEIQKDNKTPTVKGFANRIGTDVFSLWQWANKKKKNDKGELTEELVRPNFHTALTKLHELEKKIDEDKLNEKQELFCKLYATDREFFGNGVETYLEVYEIDRSKPNWYKTACVCASKLLSNAKVFTRINELLEDGGLNDVNVDKQLMFLINQFEDKSAKLQAIREYNKLRSRITEKIDHTTKGKELPTPIYNGESTKTV